MDRVKSISNIVLENYADRFGPDFEKNKKALNEISVTRSKILRNRVAGYITSYLRKQKVQDKNVPGADIEPQDQISEEKEINNL
jgi:small subunit ribosomal protein S17e